MGSTPFNSLYFPKRHMIITVKIKWWFCNCGLSQFSSLTYHNHDIDPNRIIDNKLSQTFLPVRLPSPISRFKTVKADVIWAMKIAIMTRPSWIQMMEKMRPTTDFGVLSPYLWRYTVLMEFSLKTRVLTGYFEVTWHLFIIHLKYFTVSDWLKSLFISSQAFI